MEQLHDIVGIKKNPSRKRVGRGSSAGGGNTSGRGNKGQKSRTGGQIPAYFEGGQTPLIRRLAKRRGFRSHRKFKILRINLKDLAKYAKDGQIIVRQLIAEGQITPGTKVKILGEGGITAPYTVQVHFVSGSARAKIEEQGGSVEIIQ